MSPLSLLEIVGFGPNGAGKTTTIKWLISTSDQAARIAGYDVHENSLAVRQRIGYLPETPPLYADMTVEGSCIFCGADKGVPAGDRSGRNAAIQRAVTCKKSVTSLSASCLGIPSAGWHCSSDCP